MDWALWTLVRVRIIAQVPGTTHVPPSPGLPEKQHRSASMIVRPLSCCAVVRCGQCACGWMGLGASWTARQSWRPSTLGAWGRCGLGCAHSCTGNVGHSPRELVDHIPCERPRVDEEGNHCWLSQGHNEGSLPSRFHLRLSTLLFGQGMRSACICVQGMRSACICVHMWVCGHCVPCGVHRTDYPGRQWVVSPRVRSAAREHFGCPSLAGMPLEDYDVGPGIRGHHWEARLMGPEVRDSGIFF